MTDAPIRFNHSCLKRLRAVEAEPNVSSQHEFNGVAQLKAIFGTTRVTMPCRFSVRGERGEYLVDVTWYDSRENQAHRSAEYRLYFQTNSVMQRAKEGDDVLIGIDEQNNVRCVLIPRE